MKKLFTLILLLGGFVGTANAAKLYVNTSTNASWWTNVRIYAYNSDSDKYNNWEYSEDGVVSSTETFFGKEWYVFDMGNYSNAIVQYFESSNHTISNQSSEIIGINSDRFIFIPGTQTDGKWVWYESGYTFRCNILNNWGATSCNMIVEDANTLSYTLDKSVIGNNNVIWFRILNQEGQIYPDADGAKITLGSSTTNYYNNVDETNWSFGIDVPSYDYDKIVVKAVLSGTTWTISADAYVPVTTNASGYCTLTINAPLTIEGATAYYAKDKNNGSATAVKITNPAAKTPMLIKGDVSTKYLFAVAASGTDYSSENAFKAGTGAALESTTDGKYNYILNGGVFKAANGQTVGTNKAYLQLSSQAGARGALIFDNEEETGINIVTASTENVNAYYNLNGQRITSPSKGLYIVNGRKVIMK